MNVDLLSAFFERDLTVAEEEELGRILDGSVEVSVSFAEKMKDYYESLGLPVPELPGGGEMGGGAAGDAGFGGEIPGGTAPGGATLTGGGIIGSGKIGLGWLFAVIAGGALMAGSIATYKIRRSPAGEEALKKAPASRMETIRPREEIREAGKKTGESNTLRSVQDAPETRTKESRAAGNVLVIRVSVEEPSPIMVTIYGQSGRQVYRKAMGTVNPGRYEFRWDGLDDAGRPVPAGDYRIAVQSNQGVMEKILKVSAAE